MLIPSPDPGDSRPMYEQLYDTIRQGIESGALHVGEKLPSKRSLSAELGISTVTVETAYSQLAAEGYLRSEAKRGYFVEPVQAAPPSSANHTPVLSPQPEVSYRYDFGTSGTDISLFPFSVWSRLTRQVLAQPSSELLSAPHPQGIPQLRQAIAAHLRQFRGIEADPEQIIVGAGSEFLIGILTQLLGKNRAWAVENPGYRKIDAILRNCGVTALPVDVDAHGLRVDQLCRFSCSVVHVTPSHHYPLGLVMPVSRRGHLLDWAAAAPDRYIIEDDYDSEFRYTGRPIPALQSLDRQERVIYLNTFTRTLAPSLRISYLVLPPKLLGRYRNQFRGYSSTVPAFEQYTLAAFMAGGHLDRLISRNRKACKVRQEAFLSAAKETGLLSVGTVSGLHAGLHLLLQLDLPESEEALAQQALEQGVRVIPLRNCFLVPPTSPGRPTLVLGYAHMTTEEIQSACRLLAKAWGI